MPASIYTDDFADRMVHWFKSRPVEGTPFLKRQITRTNPKTGIQTHENEYQPRISADIPYFLAFADEIGVDDETLKNWSRVHPRFAYAYARAKEWQKLWMVRAGLSGLVNPAAYIFTAKNLTDMTDTRQINNTTITVDLALIAQMDAAQLKEIAGLLEARLSALRGDQPKVEAPTIDIEKSTT